MNRDLKYEFLSYIMDKEPFLLSPDETYFLAPQCFKFLKPYEEKWGLDVSCQVPLEVDIAIDRISKDVDISSCKKLTRDMVPISITKVLYLYNMWRCRDDKSIPHKIRIMRRADLALALMRFVGSPKGLEEALDRSLSPAEDLTSDCLTRGFCWLTYYGLESKEIFSLRHTDVKRRPDCTLVKFDKGSIQLNGDAAETITNLSTASHFNLENDNYKARRGLRAREDNDLLLRRLKINRTPPDYESDRGRKVAVDNLFLRLREKDRLAVAVTPQSIYESGIFYRAWRSEVEDGYSPNVKNPVESDRRLTRSEYGVPEIDNLVDRIALNQSEYFPGRGVTDYDTILKRARHKIFNEYNVWKKYFT